MPTFELQVRLRHQRHYLHDGDAVFLAITSNNTFGTQVTCFREMPPAHGGMNHMIQAIGTVNPHSWAQLMEYRSAGPHRADWASGPRVGRHVLRFDDIHLIHRPQTDDGLPAQGQNSGKTVVAHCGW